MTPTLLLIQKTVTESKIPVQNFDPVPKAKTKKSKTPSKSTSSEHSDFGPDRFSEGVHIFCDGACEPNPGAGGWGYVVYENGVEVAGFCGGSTEATNNVMELFGLLSAIEKAKSLVGESGDPVTIWSDSKYCTTGVSDWRHKWKRNGWRKSPAATEHVKNVDLWRAIDEALSNAGDFGISIRWVKGHSGIVGNERADQLAEEGRRAAIERAENSAGFEMDERYRQIMEVP
ncbi:putative ribonuclease HI [Agrobacterium tumefaciens CCNWGS0286]|nr:putative ribonuclease HI [Agrobacterium tumefaciens CCNWGS0286]